MEFWLLNPGYDPRYVDCRVKLQCNCGDTLFLGPEQFEEAGISVTVYQCNTCGKRHYFGRELDLCTEQWKKEMAL